MKKISLLLICISLITNAFSQELSNKDVKTEESNTTKIQRFSRTFSIGSQVSIFNKRASFSSYANACFNYSLSNKLSISTGVLLQRGVVPTLMCNENGFSLYNRALQSYAYSSFNYLASDRLTINGSVMYPIGNQASYKQENGYQMNPAVYRIGAEYKITENLRIGVQVIRTTNTGASYSE